MMASGADTIPREYHRKVLKKIAQLTKVKTANQWVHFDAYCLPAQLGPPTLKILNMGA